MIEYFNNSTSILFYSSYFADEWSECSKTCGSGRRTRTVTCRQEFAGDFMTTVSFRKCKGLPKPTAHERCTVQECAHWKITSDWSDVSKRFNRFLQHFY